MPRKPRAEVAGGVHHICAHSVAGRELFEADSDRHAYLGLLEAVTAWYGWNCLAFCLMTNHIHLLVRTPEPNLGTGMQRLHGDYAQGLNKRHGMRGSLFDGRFLSKLVDSDAYLLTVTRYIAMNPVKARLCSRPEEYEWSSCLATLRPGRIDWLDADRLLSYLEWLGGDPARHYPRVIAMSSDEDDLGLPPLTQQHRKALRLP